jgi:hypothetical protein
MEVTLLDRSGTRCRLARRAVRILGLENVEVVQGDTRAVERQGPWDAVVFRASLPPGAALDAGRPLITTEGCVVVGLSRIEPPGVLPVTPDDTRLEVLEIDERVLDSPAWLLRMTLTDSPTTNGSPT